MDRAGSILAKLGLLERASTLEQRMARCWASAVGRQIASRSRVLKLAESTLIVEVEDAVWQRQLQGLKKQILGRLRTESDSRLIRNIRFQVARPRKTPKSQPMPSRKADEADGIEDPTLRKLYIAARKKESA